MADDDVKPEGRITIDGYVYVLEGPVPVPVVAAVELSSIVGLKSLDAVDFTNERIKRWTEEWEDCAVCRFRLDGKVYMAIEDPSDGYRSHLASLSEYQDVCPMRNVFPAVQVLARHRTSRSFGGGAADVVELIDVVTGKTVLEVGTDKSDDYYPSFVASF